MGLLIKASMGRRKGKPPDSLDAVGVCGGMRKNVTVETFSFPAIALKASEVLFAPVFI